MIAEIFGLGSWTGVTMPVTGGLGGLCAAPTATPTQVSMQLAGRVLKTSGGSEVCGKARGWGAGPAFPPRKEKVL